MIKITLLGTGDPLGSPVLFENNNKSRLRPSLLVEYNNTILLFDASPDIRQQLLHAKITHLDGVFITHIHFDHFWGLGDLAQLTWIKKNNFPIYVNNQTKKVIDEIYSWMNLDFKIINKPISIEDIKISYFSIKHSVELFGFIIEIADKKIVYAPDLNSTLDIPQNADLLIVDGMYILGKYIKDDDHLGDKELQKAIDSFKAKKVWLVGFSEYGYKKSAVEAMKELNNKYLIPNDFQTINL